MNYTNALIIIIIIILGKYNPERVEKLKEMQNVVQTFSQCSLGLVKCHEKYGIETLHEHRTSLK